MYNYSELGGKNKKMTKINRQIFMKLIQTNPDQKAAKHAEQYLNEYICVPTPYSTHSTIMFWEFCSPNTEKRKNKK